MPATTLKLTPDLKARIAAVVRGTGKSVHAFMVEAVAEQTRLAERRRQFLDDASKADADFERRGVGYAAADVHAWLRGKAAGKKVRRPRAKSWRK